MKKVLVVVLSIAMVLSFSACNMKCSFLNNGDKPSQSGNNSGNSETKPIGSESVTPEIFSGELTATIRDFKPDGLLFEGIFAGEQGLVATKLGDDKKPVYNLSAWKEAYGDDVTDNKLQMFFNDVEDVNLKTTKAIKLRKDGDFWTYDSSVNARGEEQDGFFPIDNELYGNSVTVDGDEKTEWPHNYHFSLEIHEQFTYSGNWIFEFSGDDDVWVYINNKLVIDLGGIHGAEDGRFELDEIASQVGIKKGDLVDFDMFYMERHTDGSNLMIRTNLDFKAR